MIKKVKNIPIGTEIHSIPFIDNMSQFINKVYEFIPSTIYRERGFYMSKQCLNHAHQEYLFHESWLEDIEYPSEKNPDDLNILSML